MPMKNSQRSVFLLFTFVVVATGTVFLFQNCGKFETLVDGKFSRFSRIEKIKCLENFSSYSCVIDKNSVYEKGKISETNVQNLLSLKMKKLLRFLLP